MNFQNDLDQVLMDMARSNMKINFHNSKELKPAKVIVLPDYNYRNDPIPTQNAFKYVCGYIWKKALNVHNNCNTCNNFGKQCEILNVENLLNYYEAFDNTNSDR